MRVLAIPFAVLLVCAAADPAPAVLQLPTRVLAGGGDETSGGSYNLRCTIGQTAIGLTDGNSIDGEFGFWLKYVATVSGVGDDPLPRVPWAFEQTHPNPFNPMTTLRFSLPEPSHVSLVVYDVRGHSIRTLVDGVRDAGVHDQTWDGRDDRGASVASGVYFARIVSDHGLLVRKMVLGR